MLWKVCGEAGTPRRWICPVGGRQQIRLSIYFGHMILIPYVSDPQGGQFYPWGNICDVCGLFRVSQLWQSRESTLYVFTNTHPGAALGSSKPGKSTKESALNMDIEFLHSQPGSDYPLNDFSKVISFLSRSFFNCKINDLNSSLLKLQISGPPLGLINYDIWVWT